MKKGIMIAGMLFIFFYVTILKVPSFSEAACIWDKEFKKIKLKGVVVKKYLDSNEHSYPMLQIRQLTIDTSILINLKGDTSGCFYKLFVGDTVVKEMGANTIYVKNLSTTRINVDFGCRK